MYGVRVATAALLTIFGAQTALAQARFYDWSGVYVGANAGYGSGSVTEIASSATTSSTETISGAVLGGHIGGNLQYQGLLLGAQLDGDWSNQRSSGGSINTKLTWLATARMRVGYAYDNIAYYC